MSDRLQNRVPRFNSGRGLQQPTPTTEVLPARGGRDRQRHSDRRQVRLPAQRCPEAVRRGRSDMLPSNLYAMQQNNGAMRYHSVIPMVYHNTSTAVEPPLRQHDQMTTNTSFEATRPMSTLALSNLLQTSPRLFGRFFEHCSAFWAGIDEARAMALRYDALAQLSDSELAARGLERADIPRAVLTSFGRG